jgi:hypothetical protein
MIISTLILGIAAFLRGRRLTRVRTHTRANP